MSENLAKLAQKIDFANPVETAEQMETDSANDEEKEPDEGKELTAFQASLWPWDSVRTKLRCAHRPGRARPRRRQDLLKFFCFS